MPETVRNEEDERAYEESIAKWYQSMMLPRPGPTGEPAPRDKWYPERLARHAFGAGMEHGLSKRGCLHPNCGECNGGEDA